MMAVPSWLLEVRRGLCIVAHPDDESMWFGGLILSTPQIDWTVIACSIPRRDPIRAFKFYDACALLGAQGRVLPFVEGDMGSPLNLSLLNLEAAEVVATHNSRGEYGHPHHMQVHEKVCSLNPKRRLTSGYGTGDADVVVSLDNAMWERKRAAILCYDHTTVIDKKPKGQALLDRYGSTFNLREEGYHAICG